MSLLDDEQIILSRAEFNTLVNRLTSLEKRFEEFQLDTRANFETTDENIKCNIRRVKSCLVNKLTDLTDDLKHNIL